ncbi:MAG: sodium:proton antiporter [Spirochaetaceae bacterium]|nr:MAG: sodium:proton antiporter [Spirochaetaceae bacterium]
MVSTITGLLYPFVVLFGIYIIVNGHDTPGGGFQGGAILAAMFIGRYIVDPTNDLSIERAVLVEKAIFAAVIVIPAALVLSLAAQQTAWLREPYLIAMNLLIGFKVAIGLTILVFRYAFYEDS